MKIILLAASLAAAQTPPSTVPPTTLPTISGTASAPKVTCSPVRHYSVVWRRWGFVSYPWYYVWFTTVCK